MFVTFEGIDGAGKSTQVRLVASLLRERGHEVVVTREPGGTPLGEGVRDLLLRGPEITPWAETLLFAAARAELVEGVIRPALQAGSVVLSDRYVDSSIAYQGVGRGLGVEAVADVNLTATGGLLPELTFLLLLDPREARLRQASEPDRIELEHDAFLAAVDRAYRELLSTSPERYVPLDATEAPDELARRASDEVERQLARAARSGTAA